MNRKWRGIALASLAVLFVGCSSTVDRPEPILTPIEVVVPQMIGCVPPNMSEPPAYPDSDAALRAARDAASRYQLMYAGRNLRTARLNEIEPVIAGCPKAPRP